MTGENTDGQTMDGGTDRWMERQTYRQTGPLGWVGVGSVVVRRMARLC